MKTKIQTFIEKHIEEKSLVKIQGTPISTPQIKRVLWKPIETQKGLQWQLVETHATKDLTYTFEWEEGFEKLLTQILTDSKNMMIFTQEVNWQLVYSKKGNISIKQHQNQSKQTVDWQHNRQKEHVLSLENATYLKDLGLSNNKGQITKAGRDKFKQISHIIQLLEKLFDGEKMDWNIADLGAGKGYLSFGLYDYLKNQDKNPAIRAIEMRENLVEDGNALANKMDFKQLKFEANKIEEVDLAGTDMLLALHACDTATDDAIIKGIQANAPYIILAPCCHKALRKDWQVKEADDFHNFALQHNIYQERMAEMLTDSIRGLLLSYFGYEVKIMDFISTEHTPKNVMIIAERNKNKAIIKPEDWKELEDIKQSYGIEAYYLEEKLKNYLENI